MISCTWYDPASRDQIHRRKRGEGNIFFPCSVDHEQDWQPYPVDPYSAMCTYLHLSLCGVMGSIKCRGRSGILPATYCFFLHPIKGHLQFCSTFFSFTEFPHFCSFLFLFCRLPIKNGLHRFCFLKKNLNASRPSEHPPVRGKIMSKRLGGIIACKDQTYSWHLRLR